MTFDVDYPDRDLNRLTTFFRFFTVIPPALMLAFLLGPAWGWGIGEREWVGDSWRLMFATGAVLFVPVLLMILFRRKYPRWWFDWNVNLTKFTTRVGVYAALLTDEFPSTERDQAVHIDIAYRSLFDFVVGVGRWSLRVSACAFLLVTDFYPPFSLK